MSSPGRTAEDRAIKCAAGAFRTAAWILRLYWSTPDQRLHDLLNRMLDQISRAVPIPAVGDAIQHLQASASRFELSFDGQSDLEFQHSAEALEKEVEDVLSKLNAQSGEQSGRSTLAQTHAESSVNGARDCILDRFRMRTGRHTEPEKSALKEQSRQKFRVALGRTTDSVFRTEPVSLIDNFLAVWELVDLADQLRKVPFDSEGLPSARVHEILRSLSGGLHDLFDALQPIRDEIVADLRRRRFSMIQRMTARGKAAAFVIFEDQLQPLREKHIPAVDDLLQTSTGHIGQKFAIAQICAGVLSAFTDQLGDLRLRLTVCNISWEKFVDVLSRKSHERIDRLLCSDPSKKLSQHFGNYAAARIQSLATILRAICYLSHDESLLETLLPDLSEASGCDCRFFYFEQSAKVPRDSEGNYRPYFCISSRVVDEILPEDDCIGVYIQRNEGGRLPVYGIKVPNRETFGRFASFWFEVGRIERWSRLYGDEIARREAREFRISFWRELPTLRKNELISSRSSRLFEPLRELLLALSRNLRRPMDEHHHYLESFVRALERVGVTVTFPDLANCPSSPGVFISEQFSPSPSGAFEVYSTGFSFRDSASGVIETEVIRLVLIPHEANEFAARLSDLNFRIPKVSSPEHQRAVIGAVQKLFNHPVSTPSENLAQSAAIPALDLLNLLHRTVRTDRTTLPEIEPAYRDLIRVFSELPHYQLVPPSPAPGTVTIVFDRYMADIDWLAPVSTMNQLYIDVNRFGIRNSHTVAPQRAQARLVLPTGSFPASAQEAVLNFLLRSTQVTVPEVQKLAVSLIGVLETQPVFRNVEKLLREWHQSHPDQLSDPVLPLLYAFKVTTHEQLRQTRRDQCFAALRPQLIQLQERFRRSYLDGSVPGSMAGAGVELERLRTDLMNRANEVLLPDCTIEDSGRCRVAERPPAEQIVECRFMANSEPHDAYIWQFGIPALQVTDQYLVSAGPSPSVRSVFRNFLAAVAETGVDTHRSQQIEKNWAQYHLQISEPSEVFREWLCSECLKEICELVESAASRQLSTASWGSIRSQYEGLIEQLSDYAGAEGMRLRLCHRWRDLGPDWPDLVELANGDLEWNKQDEFIMSRPIVENSGGKVLWKGQVKLLRR